MSNISKKLDFTKEISDRIQRHNRLT